MVSITPAKMDDFERPCDWVFVDLGFAEKSKSCGVLLNDGPAQLMQFAALQKWLQGVVRMTPGPLNLVIEAPLSVAFNSSGNPTGRAIERRGSVTRYWYVGLGTTVLVAATYLLRSLQAVEATTNIRLIEGLASFKSRGVPSDHAWDVVALRAVAWGTKPSYGRIIPPAELARDKSMSSGQRLRSQEWIAAYHQWCHLVSNTVLRATVQPLRRFASAELRRARTERR